MAHKWARWLHNPCRLGGPHRFKAGGRIRSGSRQKWKILFLGAVQQSVDFRVGGQHQKWLNWGEGRIFGCAVQKNTTKKKICRNGVSASKNTLKTPHRPFLKKGGVFQNPPTLSDFSETPPPLGLGGSYWVPKSDIRWILEILWVRPLHTSRTTLPKDCSAKQCRLVAQHAQHVPTQHTTPHHTTPHQNATQHTTPHQTTPHLNTTRKQTRNIATKQNMHKDSNSAQSNCGARMLPLN